MILLNNNTQLSKHLRTIYAGLYLIATALMLINLSGCAVIAISAAGGALVAHDKRSAQAMLDDTQIEIHASDILYGDQTLQRKIHVNVTSYNRVVLLTGEIISAELQQKVLEMVSNIDKVKQVHNELQIKNLASFSNRSGDTWLTSKVKTSMFATKDFDANRIKVVSEADSVYLMGIVNRQQGNLAAKIASEVGGVRRVVTFFEYVEDEPTEKQGGS
ncbi:MAG: BON domain-containing protein [Thiohalomonadales bacterium]